MNSQLSTYQLGKVAKVIAGGDKPKVFSLIKEESINIPVFANAEKNNGLLGYTNSPKIIEPAVTVAARGSNVGFVAIRKEPFFPVVRLLSLIPDKDSLDVDYLFYHLKQNRKTGTGSGQPQITVPDLSSQTITLPKIHIQKKLVKVLSILDKKIELNNRINSELEAMAKTLYDYWFVQFDFPDEDGKPYKTSGGKMVYNEVLKREIPEGWEVKKLSEIALTGSGGTPLKSKQEFYDNGTIPWINSGELNAQFIVSANKFITELGLEKSSAQLLPKNTILMAMYGATAGKVSFINFPATTNQAVCSINPLDEKMNVYLKFTLERLYLYLINLSSGSARDNLSQDKVKKLDVIIPTSNLLSHFHTLTDSRMELILTNLKENEMLSSLRDWLLPMLMNGQVTVE